jgi:HK97 family phage portal protein
MIRTAFAHLLQRLAAWLAPARSSISSGFPMPGRSRSPAPADLLAELKATAWTCASLNSSACAAFPPRLYVRTAPGQAAPRCLTRSLGFAEERRLRGSQSCRIEEVREHPLLDLLSQSNSVHNAFDLLELTTLSQEIHGCAYWLLEAGPLGVPEQVWPLPAHLVTPLRDPETRNLVDAYLIRAGGREERLSPERVIAFRYPDPRDPYTAGLSPLHACYEQARLMSDLTEFKRQKFDNHAIPDALICPEQIIGEDERVRFESLWNQRLRRGGAGRVLVAEKAMRVHLLEHSMGDLAALADLRATKEDICNAFGVPLAFLTTETNLANLQAAEQQHARHAILPRLRRRDEKLNEQLVPLFDPTGRLFLASDDPVPENREQSARERELALRFGVVTINEVRSEQGLPPVPWGDAPWLPGEWRQVS